MQMQASNLPVPHFRIAAYWFLLALPLLSLQCSPRQNCAQKNAREDYLSAIQCDADFAFLMGAPLSSQYAQVDAVKLVYDLKTSLLYFVQNGKYNFHYDFCSRALSYGGDLNTFNAAEYGHTDTRRFLLANLNYYRASDVYTLEFFADDAIRPEQIATLYRLTAQRVYFKDKLYLVANTGRDDSVPGIEAARFISIDRLFENQRYQPMVMSRSYGYLQQVGKADFDHHAFTVHDIILTDFLPNDLPFCQGIMTTAFQTPLAHINVLSHNRNTPNCAFKTAWTDARIQQLVGKLVYYEVLPDSIVLREAGPGEAQIYWDAKRREPGRMLPCDLRERGLPDIQQIDRNSIATVGAKAANFGEIEKIRLPDNTRIPVPEGAFAIPFYHYRQHIARHGLQGLIDGILNSDSICNNRTLLDRQLKALRDSILAKPLDSDLLRQVTKKLKSVGGYTEFRFRSSTNAEDIAGFTGAGLYDSKTGSLVRPDKTIESAIKKVWASLWALRAFEERMHAHIDQSNLAMGILVHRSFGMEAANGVAITRDLYRDAYPAFTVNVQKGEFSVVLPENQATPEQLLMNYGNLDADKTALNVQYLAHSSLNDYQPILRKDEIQLLATYLYAIKQRFYYASGQAILGPNFYNFAMDVEFKLDSGSRKIVTVQV